ncbi:MAG: hypothetical protein BWX96_03326 [Bacteroidetes bacterium ADurb.Bin145]|nr:MAG: hypothetical protein BWX96_03326 [Bacteroidetes bacterium ADurb.Bin145]
MVNEIYKIFRFKVRKYWNNYSAAGYSGKIDSAPVGGISSDKRYLFAFFDADIFKESMKYQDFFTYLLVS